MTDGWIKLHRCFIENAMAQKPYYGHLWVHLLLSAGHSERDIIWNGKKLRLQPGQFISSRPTLSNDSGIPQTTVERILDYFEGEQQIGQQKFSKFRIITIRNWEKYQSAEYGGQVNGQQADSKRTADGQQTDTNKNIKKGKKEKKTTFSQNADEFSIAKLLLDLILLRKPDFKKPDLQKWAMYIDRMIRLDGRRPERIEAVIRWCQRDSFWANNILSTAKLRKQFDQLELRMESNDGQRTTNLVSGSGGYIR